MGKKDDASKVTPGGALSFKSCTNSMSSTSRTSVPVPKTTSIDITSLFPNKELPSANIEHADQCSVEELLSEQDEICHSLVDMVSNLCTVLMQQEEQLKIAAAETESLSNPTSNIPTLITCASKCKNMLKRHASCSNQIFDMMGTLSQHLKYHENELFSMEHQLEAIEGIVLTSPSDPRKRLEPPTPAVHDVRVCRDSNDTITPIMDISESSDAKWDIGKTKGEASVQLLL